MEIASKWLWNSQFPDIVPVVNDGQRWLGTRIRELRERVGIQSQELAESLGIDPSAMSNIERGKRGVKAHELAQIAQVLGVSPLAILDESSLVSRLPVAPRAELGLRVEGRAFERLRGLAELNEVLATGGLPANPALDDVPDVDLNNWIESADSLARWAGDRLNFQADGDESFTRLASRIETELRVDVCVDEPGDGDSSLVGAAITDRSFPLIYVSSEQPRPRALFTLAHELAHVLVADGEPVTLDLDLVGRDDGERFANAFAASLLMPLEVIETMLERYGRSTLVLAILMDTLGVSYESLVYRLHNLRLINAEGRDRLRSFGLQGVLTHIEDQDLVSRLLRRHVTYPESRPPSWLVARAFAAFERGVVSIRPLAGLLAEEPDRLLQQLDEARRTGGLDQENFAYVPDGVNDEEVFSGDPV